ncbi:MAG: zf-HC2 domain-containing protein [Pyrinomonadaceae bacterium]
MNCDECKNLISVFMDTELEEPLASEMRYHLAICAECAFICEDFSSILDVCTMDLPSEGVPPNSKALWCRINNIIENDAKAAPPLPVEGPRRRIWQLSFLQLSAAVLCIAVISSLLTFVAIQNYSQPADGDFTTRSSASQTTFEKVLSKVGLMETPQQARDRRVKEQHAAIEYWNARVQSRRQQWDRATRDAFDRNLHAIQESVNDYTMILQKDPEDELSGEMLDSVLNEKMNLLRDFAAL